MRFKCAVFDFDGTLFDSMSAWESVGEIYLRSLGKEPMPHMRDDVRELSLYDSACYLRTRYALDISPAVIMSGINRVIENFYIHEVQPKPGAIRFLEYLRQHGVSLCVASASDRYLIEAALSRCGVTPLIDAIFTCTEVGCSKNDPIIFRTAMQHFGAARSNTVIFEDAIHAVRTAKRDGFYTVAVYDSSEKHQAELEQLCDCYIKDFEHTDPFLEFAWK